MGWLRILAAAGTLRELIRAEFHEHRAACARQLEVERRFGDEQSYIDLCAAEEPEERMRENVRAVVIAAAIGLAVVGAT